MKKSVLSPKSSAPPVAAVVESWLPPALRWPVGALGALFLVGVFSDTAGLRWVDGIPRPARYFTQVACLFPSGAEVVTDYRAEGYSCRDGRFEELDVGPYFPIDAGEKENRFYRALQFYRHQRETLQALERYVLAAHNQAVLAARARGESMGSLIGGVRFSSLRIPLGTPGEPVARYARKSMSEYPPSIIKYWYFTRRSRIRELCRELEPDAVPPGDEGEP